jgi:hypothetical protein
MSAGWEGPNELPAMDHQESKPFGPDFKNFIRSWTTVSYSILWVKFRACPAEAHLRKTKNLDGRKEKNQNTLYRSCLFVWFVVILLLYYNLNLSQKNPRISIGSLDNFISSF